MAESFQGRILLVDDNLDATELMALLLRLDGYEVTVASTAEEALEICASFMPHVICSDVYLPGMNGLELAAAIRKGDCWSKVLLIAITGWSDDETARSILVAGFDHCFIKPADFGELAEFILDYFQRCADILK